jgi:hypothetical protein
VAGNRLFALLIFFSLGEAHAALPGEIQVYTDDLEKPGEHGMELHKAFELDQE